MTKYLTTSAIERQNILNNKIAIPRIQEALKIEAFHFEGEYYLTKQMVADFYEVDIRTIDNYLASNEQELKHNGYFLCKGNKMKEIKLQFGHEKTFTTKTTKLGLFNFRAFLNIGMLLAESEKAKKIRSLILDIVISTINEKAGGEQSISIGETKNAYLLLFKKTIIARILHLLLTKMLTDTQHINIQPLLI